MVLSYDLKNDDYLDFIKKLRDEARDKDKFSHRIPILPFEADADPPYVHVNLVISGVDKGLATIRRYDLRLINYQNPLGNVIHVDEFKLYDDESRLVESGLEGLLLGLSTFIEAVSSLAELNYSGSNVDVGTSFLVTCDTKRLKVHSNVRSSLAVLCLVLCEAAKLKLLSCWLNSTFKSDMEKPLFSWLLKRINDWGDFSKELLIADLHYNDDRNCNFYLPDHLNDWNDGRRVIGVTCQNVARCLGILRAVPPPPVPMVEEYLQGTTLAEVYSVSIVFNGGGSGFIYGTINIDTVFDTLCIYARDQTESEYIESHGLLSLQDPDHAINVNHILHFKLNLMEGGDKLEVKHRLWWDTNVRNQRFDTRLSALVKGRNGYAIVYYSVFLNAIQAVVEATLLAKEGHSYASHSICVCGQLSARYRDLVYAGDIFQKYYETELFDKPVSKEPFILPHSLESEVCKGGESVKLGENMKLSRSCVAIPVEDALIIKADLKSCKGRPIVTGSMEWLPRKFGDFESIMEGHPDDSHVLQVKVKWRKVCVPDIKKERTLLGYYI